MRSNLIVQKSGPTVKEFDIFDKKKINPPVLCIMSVPCRGDSLPQIDLRSPVHLVGVQGAGVLCNPDLGLETSQPALTFTHTMKNLM